MKNNRVRTDIFSWISLPLLFFGAGVIAYRMKQGLGASTHLSDTFPWGLWISMDVLCGVALAAGAFTVAAAVYIFDLKTYRPILRPAILTGFLGYLLVIVALFIDIGRPFRIWHPLILWNPNSVMFEVAWCVILYSTVLAMEFAPIVLERFGLKRLIRILEAVTIPLVIAGVILSTLHQSSLGSLYLIVPSKLHPLWYSRMVPLFFFVSALAGGLCVLIIEGTVSQRLFHHHVEIHVFRGLARAAVVVLILYGAMKLGDLMSRGGLNRLAMDREGIFFGMEIIIGIVLPLFLYAFPGIRETRQGLFTFACFGVTGLILNRINVSLIGMAGSSGTSYFPSWMEFAITATLVLGGIALFRWAARTFPVFEKQT